MHNGHTEDGTLRTCWGCQVEHYSLEEEAYRERDWRDLCEHCMVEYDEGKALGATAIIEGRSDFERRSMPSVKRSGYMTGRFLQSCKQARDKRPDHNPYRKVYHLGGGR